MFKTIFGLLYIIFLTWFFPYVDINIYHYNHTLAELNSHPYGLTIFLCSFVIYSIITFGGIYGMMVIGNTVDYWMKKKRIN